ncbi:hypothetical protein [Aquimarina sp. RZ0]|uniref:hypothetical protein n=1 Tax=Aquimarina sp. RZ0 TaxID=2607730 RepID=UPI0011F22B4D|nr:hypothetical protein [Aquimarina sp. RZ0]KAA1239798.1 hypothetical protein F0000_27275 [Aquimarina sp. RZ0]
MRDWLTSIRPPKFIRYLFFIGYNWYRSFESERSDAHFTITIVLSLHLFLLPFILTNIQFILGYGNMVVFSKMEIILFAIISGFLQYYFFLYQNKWKHYIGEFNHIRRKQQRIGIIYLFIYIIFCLALALLPIILLFIFDIDLRNR